MQGARLGKEFGPLDEADVVDGGDHGDGGEKGTGVLDVDEIGAIAAEMMTEVPAEAFEGITGDGAALNARIELLCGTRFGDIGDEFVAGIEEGGLVEKAPDVDFVACEFAPDSVCINGKAHAISSRHAY